MRSSRGCRACWTGSAPVRRPESGDHIPGIPVRREDGIEDLNDPPALHDQREAPVQDHAGGLHHGQAQGVRQLAIHIGQKREGQMQPGRGLRLIGLGLGGDPVDRAHAECLQFDEVIAKSAGLGRAAPGTGDHVPPLRQGLVWPAGAGVEIEDAEAREGVQIDPGTSGGGEGQGRQGEARQMIGAAVIERNREIVRDCVEFDGVGHGVSSSNKVQIHLHNQVKKSQLTMTWLGLFEQLICFS